MQNKKPKNSKKFFPELTSIFGLRPILHNDNLPYGIMRIKDSYASWYIISLGNNSNEFILIDGGIQKNTKNLDERLANSSNQGKKIRAVLLTHAHSDHVGILHVLDKSTPVYVSEVDSHVLTGRVLSEGFLPRLQDKVSRRKNSAVFGINPTIVSHEQEMTIGDLNIRVIMMSGHTSGSVAYLIRRGAEDQPHVLFVGDGLDFKKNGQVANANWLFTANSISSAKSIVELTDFFTSRGIKISHVIPSHSGHSDFSSLKNFRSKK
jgi:glyoxylase-like metal-dependent hydrolase (beta-lactamase superfamily II)